MGYICYMDIMGVLYFSIFILNDELEGHMKWNHILWYIYKEREREKSQAIYQDRKDSNIWLHKDIGYHKYIYISVCEYASVQCAINK